MRYSSTSKTQYNPYRRSLLKPLDSPYSMGQKYYELSLQEMAPTEEPVAVIGTRECFFCGALLDVKPADRKVFVCQPCVKNLGVPA
jgi:hypothetical protein